ncbi:MAG: DNA gyrase C-terminal beta-propeller domain-containing protein, partial [Pseudomonadota bacterium]
FEEMAANEEFLLTVTTKGFGKRTSAYEYRTAGRGGQGIANMKLTKKNGEIVASFRVDDTDQIMMVTNGGQLIRMPVENIRFVGRQTQGVTLFRVGADEKVVSVAWVREDDEEEASLSDENSADAADSGTDATSEAEGTEE